MILINTERLYLRRMTPDDNDFILELLNTPNWKRFIGDRGVDTLESASEYLIEKVIPAYDKFGFGFYVIERREDNMRVGNCGLIRREGLDHVDIGYSLLEKFEGHGYAFEAAQAVLNYGFSVHKLEHIVAIVLAENHRSIHLIKKLGLKYESTINLPGDDEELMLFGISAPREENKK